MSEDAKVFENPAAPYQPSDAAEYARSPSRSIAVDGSSSSGGLFFPAGYQPATGPLFRSEDMQYVKLLMTDDTAYETIRELGRFKKLHFVDLSTTTPAIVHSEFYQYHKRRVIACQYWIKKMDHYKEIFTQYRISVPDRYSLMAADIRSGDLVEAVKAFIDPLDENLSKNIVFRRHQSSEIIEIQEMIHVLRYKSEQKDDAFDMERGQQFSSRILGTIPTSKIGTFERILYRVSRGNVLSTYTPMPKVVHESSSIVQQDKDAPADEDKSIFQLLFMGDQLKQRVSRLVTHSGATEYEIPPTRPQILQKISELEIRLADLRQILLRTDAEVKRLLQELALDKSTSISPWLNWSTALRQEMAISDVLKKCDQENSSRMISAEGWVPSSYVDGLKTCLSKARGSDGRQAVLQFLPNPGTPPTYFELTKFTEAFQGIVNTYGVPRYKEANPGIFTIVTFPFLFGIMYGDIGHGSCLFLAALAILYNEKKLTELEKRGELGEIASMIFGGRYLLVMMGFFALYAGTIYNDCFSIPVDAFGYHWHDDPVTNATIYDGPYPYGVDPSWYHTTNELLFMNSFKMKLAVTLGVTQMVFGIFLSASNHIYNKDYLHFFFEFIPRLLFTLCTFGYMIFIIIFKLCSTWPEGSTPPLLIQTMIAMFLSPGSVDKDKLLYENQGSIQAALLLIAVFSVPVMLFVIPCVTNSRMKRKNLLAHSPPPVESEMVAASSFSNGHHVNVNNPDLHDELLENRPPSPQVSILPSDHDPAAAPAHEEHVHGMDGPYVFSDHLIIQSIHTIEFVLGTVSNTASYLRLWALSLAHAELSGVFWDKMIEQYGMKASPPIIVAGFAIWLVATFAVLLCMDVLECFLHALRLHWVEFQNKFFAADGYLHEPFSFDTIWASQ